MIVVRRLGASFFLLSDPLALLLTPIIVYLSFRTAFGVLCFIGGPIIAGVGSATSFGSGNSSIFWFAFAPGLSIPGFIIIGCTCFCRGRANMRASQNSAVFLPAQPAAYGSPGVNPPPFLRVVGTNPEYVVPAPPINSYLAAGAYSNGNTNPASSLPAGYWAGDAPHASSPAPSGPAVIVGGTVVAHGQKPDKRIDGPTEESTTSSDTSSSSISDSSTSSESSSSSTSSSESSSTSSESDSESSEPKQAKKKKRKNKKQEKISATQQNKAKKIRESRPPVRQSDTAGTPTNTCVICVEAESEMVLVPCGHKAICESCARTHSTKLANCPVCRAAVVSIVKVYNV